MKPNNTTYRENIKNKNRSRSKQAFIAFMILCSLLICITASPISLIKVAASDTSAKAMATPTPTPTPKDEDVDEGEIGDETEEKDEEKTPQTETPKPSTSGVNINLKQYIKTLTYDPRVLLAVQGDGGSLIYEKVKSQDTERKAGEGKIIRCLTTAKSLSKNFDDVAILQPTQGTIYPGAIVFADTSLVDGMPRPLTELKRSPIDLRLDLPGLFEEGSFTVINPSDGKVQNSINKALNFWNNNASYKEGYVNASRSTFNSTIAYSSEQLAMKLGINVKWASGDASAQFGYSSSNEKTVAVVMYKQVFYTVTFDAPNSPEGFFDSSVSAEEAKGVFTSTAPPAYVSSVNYGRIIMFRLETDKSVTGVEAEAAIRYGTGAVSIAGDMKMKYDKILSNSAITVVTMGGNAEVAAESVSAKSAADLMPLIKGKNAVYSKNNPGVPIAYTVKFMKDNSIAKMGSTAEYTNKECTELPNLWVKLVHSGIYIAHFDVMWDEPGKPNNVWKEHGKTAGWQATVKLPGDATNIRLKMQNDTGLVWQPQREIINRVLQPADLNKCYKVTGTTLGSGFDNNCS